MDVAEFGAGELVARRPRGEHGRAGIERGELVDGLLVQADDAGVGEVVFRREAVGGIDEEADEKGRGREGCKELPVADAAVESGDRDEQDQRIHGKQVAGEQGSA